MSYPVPDFYDPQRVAQVYRVEYAALAEKAIAYRRAHGIRPAAEDEHPVWLLLIDLQNTFCIPGFELYVGGRSGSGAVDDNRRLVEFIYRNLGRIGRITATLDTHRARQIFHPLFFVDATGNHPAPFTDIHAADLEAGRWRFNPALAAELGVTPEYGQQIALHYARSLEARGKYALTIWPYHAMLGGIGHALVSAVEEALFFHGQVRLTQPDLELKGESPFTENYSALGPEVTTGPRGETLGVRQTHFLERLRACERLYIAGQAKSHCVAWTVSDLLDEILASDPSLARKVHLLEDCTSPVVVPGVVDHTDAADAAFARFAEAGMHIVRSDEEV